MLNDTHCVSWGLHAGVNRWSAAGETWINSLITASGHNVSCEQQLCPLCIVFVKIWSGHESRAASDGLLARLHVSVCARVAVFPRRSQFGSIDGQVNHKERNTSDWKSCRVWKWIRDESRWTFAVTCSLFLARSYLKGASGWNRRRSAGTYM